MKIGAHVSIAGNLLNALRLAQEFELDCLQIFSTSPRTWQKPNYPPELLREFKTQSRRLNITPTFVHAKYLINLSSEGKLIQEKSANSLIDDLFFAHNIASPGVIFHPHSQNLVNLTQNIKQVLRQTPEDTNLILENSAQIRLETIALILKTTASPRLKFCLDTAHLFEAGYNLNDPQILDQTLKEIDRKIGFDNWLVTHANNSQTQLASHHDRHANVKEGLLKPEVFTFLLRHPIAQKRPFILETPDNLTDAAVLANLK